MLPRMRICILGATGLVGRESIALARRAWPQAELMLFASRDQTLALDGAELAVRAAASLEANDAPRGDLALVALDDPHSERFVPRLLALGYRVVDKSNTYRDDPSVPLVVAGVNSDLVTDAVSLVANPNCTTIPFCLAVAPLTKHWPLVSVRASSYQAISGAGLEPLDTFLEASATGYAQRDRLGQVFDANGYAGNTVPHNGKTDASGFSAEERKLMHESRKILAAPTLTVSAQCCRVPVAVGHYLNVWLTFGEPVAPQNIEACWQHAPFVHAFNGPAGEGMSALVTQHHRDLALAGRVRLDPADASGHTVCITVIGDNLRLGAATNAVRIASRWFPAQTADLAA